MPVCGDEDVLWLQVAVDDTGGVQALDTFDDLSGVEPRAITSQPTPASQLCSQITTGMEVLQS